MVKYAKCPVCGRVLNRETDTITTIIYKGKSAVLPCSTKCQENFNKYLKESAKEIKHDN